jgi:hypothetical protein
VDNDITGIGMNCKFRETERDNILWVCEMLEDSDKMERPWQAALDKCIGLRALNENLDQKAESDIYISFIHTMTITTNLHVVDLCVEGNV